MLISVMYSNIFYDILFSNTYTYFFSLKDIYQSANHGIENNASLPVQKIYEAQRLKERALSDTAFSDFNDVRSTLTRIKTKKANLVK